MKIHAEIEYETKDGGVHSDICPPNCSHTGLNNPEYREFLHQCLDEYLDKSGGTGGFYIKNEDHYFDFNDCNDHLCIPSIVEGYAQIFMNDRMVGHINTIAQLQSVRAQLKKDESYTDGCCIKWINPQGYSFEIDIDENGKLNHWPTGFFEDYDNNLMELL